MSRTSYERKKYLFAVTVTFFLCVMLVLPLFPVNAQNSVSDMSKYFSCDFEKYKVNDSFVSSIDNAADYMDSSSLLKVVSSDLSLDGSKSLAINKTDMRWWAWNVNKESIAVRFSVKIDENFNNTLKIMISTQDAATNTEGNGGTFAVITTDLDEDGNNKAVLKNHTGKTIMTLSTDIRYIITAYFTKGSNKYDIVVDGNDGEEDSVFIDNKFASTLYTVTGMRIAVTDNTPAENINPDVLSYIRIDNVEVYVKGKKYAQKYSSQQTGEIPTISLPQEEDSSDITVYANNKRLYFQNAPVIKNKNVFVDGVALYKCLGFNVSYDKLGAVYSMENDTVKISGAVSSNEVSILNKLTDEIKKINVNNSHEPYGDTFFVSVNFINETINAKVWYDKAHKMLVITTGKYKKDNLLVSLNNALYMNGEPYYEISFNKYDLFTQIMADYVPNSEYKDDSQRYSAAKAALEQLSRDGFKTIRVFCSSGALAGIMYDSDEMNLYLKAMDEMFDLCDMYNIRVVVCMNLISDVFTPKQYISQSGWVNKNESTVDLVADANSESRQNMYKYLEKFINKYKDRDTVLMWEIQNEANLKADIGCQITDVSYSLLQLSEFYRDCAAKIREFDNTHIISGGDAILRPAQWHLLEGVMRGDSVCDWNVDTAEQRLKALWVLNKSLDVMSTHTYGIGMTSLSNESIYIDESGELSQYGFSLLMNESHLLSKPLYNGESAGTMDTSLDNYVDINVDYLDSIIENGVQLTHWWTFRSDRAGFNDPTSWRCDSGDVYNAIVAANKRIKETYIVNEVWEGNTNNFWNDPYFDVIKTEDIVDGMSFIQDTSLKMKVKNVIITASALVLTAISLLIMSTTIKIKKKRTA